MGCLLLTLLLATCAVAQQKRSPKLKDIHFPLKDYEESDEPEIDERQSGPDYPMYPLPNQISHNRFSQYVSASNNVPDELDPNIKFDSDWGTLLELGQLSAVSLDPNGNIAIFHRGDRVWVGGMFGNDHKLNSNFGPIPQNTIFLLDKDGSILLQWGRNMFYMPHGLTIDSGGNYWITDVAMHQVFKFDGKDIENHKTQLMTPKFSQHPQGSVNNNNLFENSIVKPTLILGEAFQPGNDNTRFCQPSAVAVQQNGDFFVSDGYCNSRIIKFNKFGERITQWGRAWTYPKIKDMKAPINAFNIPHAVALAEEHDYIFIADRENGRVVCSFASNGTVYKEYKNPKIGEAIYSIAYANNRLYVVNGKRSDEPFRIRGFILDMFTGEILSQFAPRGDMIRPHDIAVTPDEKEIYVVDLSSPKIYRFYQDIKHLRSPSSRNSSIAHSAGLLDSSELGGSKKSSQRVAVLAAIIAALFFIGTCIFLAALLAKYQKRGRLFPPRRRRSEWNADRRDNFKLSDLLESRRKFKLSGGRPNSREFSKLSTEPESTDDENDECSMEKVI
ncbi:hypothetical protein QAD02_001563 [Eretmocerus hayati]|uniref:Uncharacterized protein n=1 Tax=Eretmocerus hayati TaxID=131215 RepID=A0ACC2NGR8_9HYME|nr:hypothetical protein QAD02_001563 [Eretmocerus hayati]